MLTDENLVVPPAWRPHSHAYSEALAEMKSRMTGDVKSLITPWNGLNRAILNGLDFHSMTVIGGRSGSGKTLICDQLIRQCFDLNPHLDLQVLQFSLEMVGRNGKIREFSSITKKSYQYLCSAEQEDVNLDDETFKKCYDHAKKASKLPINVIEMSMTVPEFVNQVELFMRSNILGYVTSKKTSNKKPVYKPTIVTLDHTILLKRLPGQQLMEMLSDLGEACTMLKKRYPIAFILLSQLNRDILRPERNEPGKYGNYILDSDLFGSDAILQHCDTFIGITRPALRFIREYGPERYIINDDSVIAAHVSKNRYGYTGIIWLEAEFEHMEIHDGAVPDCKIRA